MNEERRKQLEIQLGLRHLGNAIMKIASRKLLDRHITLLILEQAKKIR